MSIAFQELTLGVSLIALLISIKSWQKSRAIYGIETTTLRQVRGRRDDTVIEEKLNEISKKLDKGKYTVLHVSTRESDGDFQIFLGRIKK